LHDQINFIYKNFDNGVTNLISLENISINLILQKGLCVLLSPMFYKEHTICNMIYTKNKFIAKITGKIINLNKNQKFILPVAALIPIFELILHQLTNNSIKISIKSYVQILETLFECFYKILRNLQEKFPESIKSIQEYKKFHSAFFNFFLSIPNNFQQLISPHLFETILKILNLNKRLKTLIINQLFNTHNFWPKTQIRDKYWKLLAENIKFIENYENKVEILIEILDDLNENLNDFVKEILKNCDPLNTVEFLLKYLFNKNVNSNKNIMIILKILSEIAIKLKSDQTGILLAFHNKIIEIDNSKSKLFSLNLIDLITRISKLKEITKKQIWINFIFKFISKPSEIPISGCKIQANSIQKINQNFTEIDLDELESRVFTENNSINETISKMKGIKGQILDNSKTIDSTRKCLNFEEKTEILEPVPPPAPRGEKSIMAKKFNFDTANQAEPLDIPNEPLNSEKINENSKIEKEPFSIKRKEKPKFLNIDTESINQEFNWGGEKGEKIIDENLEQQKFEEEILELAKYCVNCMEKNENLLENVVKEILIKIISEKQNFSGIYAISKILPKIISENAIFDLILQNLNEIYQKNTEILINNEYFMKKLLKTLIICYSKNDFIKYEQLLKIYIKCSNFIINNKQNYPESLLEIIYENRKIDPEILSQCLKNVLIKMINDINEMKLLELNKNSVILLGELSYAILINSHNFANELFLYKNTYSINSYTNLEFANILINFLLSKIQSIEFTKLNNPIKKPMIPIIFVISSIFCHVLHDLSDNLLISKWLVNLQKYIQILCENIGENELIEENFIMIFGFILQMNIAENSIVSQDEIWQKFLYEFCEFLQKELSENTKFSEVYKKKLISANGKFLFNDLEPFENCLTKAKICEFYETCINLSKEQDKLSKIYLTRMLKHIKNAIHLNKVTKTDEKINTKNMLKNIENDALISISSIVIENTQFSIIRQLKKYQLIVKYRQILKNEKKWVGFWRNIEIFDKNTIKIPYKISNHHFTNTMKCILNIRNPQTNFYDKNIQNLSEIKPETHAKLSPNFYENPLFLQEISQISAEKTSHSLFEQIPIKIREKLFEPIKCEIFKGIYIEKGYLLIFYKHASHKPYLVFIAENPMENEDKRTMFNKKYKNGINLFKIIRKYKLSNIKKIIKKQIVELKSGLEITFYNGKILLFNCLSEEKRDLLGTKLVRLREKWCQFLQYDSTLDPIKIFEKSQISTMWENNLISTLDYILALNSYSSRSFSNLSQYPIFPWILFENGKNSVKRDLSKNIGLNGDQDRIEEYKKKFLQEDLTNLGHFNFGSTYSNPGIIFQYMMRIYPFFEGYLKFFNGLDDPNRMFHSICDTSISCTKDLSDVRELIPEFYYMPEIFLNNENLILGIRNGNKVNNVILPEWAKNNPYLYVLELRKLLENNENYIEKWIDLIFGYLQNGKQAELSTNLFPTISYTPHEILSKIRRNSIFDKNLYEGYYMQAYHWGQIPQQLLRNKHRTRKIKENINFNIFISFIKIPNNLKIMQIYDEISRISLIMQDKEKIQIVKMNTETQNFINVFTQKEPNLAEKLIKIDPLFKQPILFMKFRKMQYLAMGGYWDGSIKLIPVTNLIKTPIITLKYHTSTITCLEKDLYERLIILGTKQGEISIYSIHENMFWRPEFYAHNHTGEITGIFISDNMQLFASCGIDGKINLYNLDMKPKLFRTIIINQKIENIILCQNPIPAIAIKFSQKWISYSINGEKLYEIDENSKIIGKPIICSDLRFINYVGYIRKLDHKLKILEMPGLIENEKMSEKVNDKKLKFLGNNGERMIICGDENNELFFLTISN